MQRDWAATLSAAPGQLRCLVPCRCHLPGSLLQHCLATAPEGVWMLDGRVALQLFNCSDRICGRIVWLVTPRNATGHLDLDKNNPDPALRKRSLCGLTILWNLEPSSGGVWKDGWLYNPDDGKTYRVTAEFRSADVIDARIYVGVPLFGRTKTLLRVPRLTSEGWC